MTQATPFSRGPLGSERRTRPSQRTVIFWRTDYVGGNGHLELDDRAGFKTAVENQVNARGAHIVRASNLFESRRFRLLYGSGARLGIFFLVRCFFHTFSLLRRYKTAPCLGETKTAPGLCH